MCTAKKRIILTGYLGKIARKGPPSLAAPLPSGGRSPTPSPNLETLVAPVISHPLGRRCNPSKDEGLERAPRHITGGGGTQAGDAGWHDHGGRGLMHSGGQC
jgi:hypothetical protein